MNTRTIALTLVSTLSLVMAQDPKAFENDLEKVNYAIGLNVGSNFKQGNFQYDSAAFDRGMKDALTGKPAMTQPEAQEVIRKYQTERRAAISEKNKADGEAFLAANKSKPDVKVFPSGLQYKVLAEGSGDSPKPEDHCIVKYRGTLIDGTEFDNSEKSPGGTVSFPANRVIPGWTEALTNMKPGAKWQLFIPASLAYGEAGNRNIAPNSALLFDVELVSFSAPPPPPPPAPAPAPLTSDIIKVPSLEEMKKGAKIETIKAEDVEKLQKEKPKQ